MNVMKKSRILIAEDERDLAGILRDTLVTLDFAVTLAHDGASALEAYAAERPDLLVTDVMMPVMDGLSAQALFDARTRGAHPGIAATVSSPAREGKRSSG